MANMFFNMYTIYNEFNIISNTNYNYYFDNSYDFTSDVFINNFYYSIKEFDSKLFSVFIIFENYLKSVSLTTTNNDIFEEYNFIDSNYIFKNFLYQFIFSFYSFFKDIYFFNITFMEFSSFYKEYFFIRSNFYVFDIIQNINDFAIKDNILYSNSFFYYNIKELFIKFFFFIINFFKLVSYVIIKKIYILDVFFNKTQSYSTIPSYFFEKYINYNFFEIKNNNSFINGEGYSYDNVFNFFDYNYNMYLINYYFLINQNISFYNSSDIFSFYYNSLNFNVSFVFFMTSFFIFFILYSVYKNNTVVMNPISTVMSSIYYHIIDNLKRSTFNYSKNSKKYIYYNNVYNNPFDKYFFRTKIFVPWIFIIFVYFSFFNLVGIFPEVQSLNLYFSFIFFISFVIFFGLTFYYFFYNKKFFFSFFKPSGLKKNYLIFYFLYIIEPVLYFFRIVSLTARMFINLNLGQLLLRILIFMFIISVEKYFFVVPVLPFFLMFIFFIFLIFEIIMALFQAYIYMIMNTIYIKDVAYIKY
uniref:ATP synthase subunit a n=1 Tax=Acavomonas peruviana TaxID=1542312 RepID=V5KVI5_9ALVE|nr:ATP synthase F0 subunit 6 [Acavomonas peruviana]